MGSPILPFMPFPSAAVAIAAGGIAPGAIAADAVGVTALVAGAIHSTAIAADARGQIKRIYRGSTTMLNTQGTVSVTLSPTCDPAKSELRVHGWYINTTTLSAYYFPAFEINAGGTAVVMTRGASNDWGVGVQMIAKWEVTERY